jgi:Zn-dependent protease with chaperone function
MRGLEYRPLLLKKISRKAVTLLTEDHMGAHQSSLSAREERHAKLRGGSLSLANLFLRSLVTLGILYGALTLLLIITVEAGYLDALSALIVGIGTCLFQFVFGPWILDLSLRFFYALSWVEKESLPEHLAQFTQRICDDHGISFPSFGIINDGAPQAFTYGHHPSNARIVISRGLLELLSPEESEAVIAHELGHVCHWDMVVMTIAQVVPILAYYVYRTTSESSSRKSGKKGASSLIAAGAYLVYICSELAVLWFSRVREYYADEFSAQATKDPSALARALVKIGYGLAAAGPKTNSSENPPQAESGRYRGAFEALNIFDKRASLNLVISTSATKGSGELDPERIKDAIQWDLWNPWASYYELLSTHPLVAKRLERLGDLAAVSNQPPFIIFDREQPESYWDEFLVDVVVMILPKLGLLLGTIILLSQALMGEVHPHWFGFALALLGGGQIIKTALAYRAPNYPRATVADLLKEVKVSPVRPVAVTLSGTVIGKGVPGFILSEDFIVQDESGILFLDYRQPIPLWDAFFGLLKAGSYQGKHIEVQGWYRRAPVPFLEISSITETESHVTRRCYTRFAKYIFGIFFLITGIGLLF